MTILEAAGLLDDGRVSSVELTRQCLAAIERLQPKLNAFITITAEAALERARLMDEERSRGQTRGTLHGIPIALKDVYCTQGVRTTCGSKLFTDFVPDHDAAVVERLDAAGAVMLGKLNMHELAYGVTSNNPHFGPVRNPWNTDCIPGGSSGGSGAAVASEMCFMATGSDTGGSIRLPAAYCGTVGLKPTTGRVSRYGVLPLDFTLDHMGPLTRSVRDAAIVLGAIAGHDPRDDSSSSEPPHDYLPPEGVAIRGLRVGIPSNFYYERLDPEVERALQSLARTAEELGAVLVPVSVPDIGALNVTSRVILLCEAAATMERFLHRRGDIGADVMALLDQGRLVPATDYINAQRLRRVFQREFSAVWKHADCLLIPCTPTPAPRIGQASIELGGVTEDVRIASTRFLRGINMLGLPALSIPCGVASSGLPMGAQIVGPAFQEALILRVGAALEDATGAAPRPPIR